MKIRLALLLASLASLTTAHAATDAYRQWAVSKWGVTIAGADNTRANTWGETADPDRDGIPNLLEYLADTNPTAHTLLSDVYTFSVPESGAPQFRYPQLLSWQRTDDPDVRTLCQTSSDLHTWLPAAPADLNSPAPANPFLTTEDTGVVSRGLRQVRYRDLQSLAGRPGAFMRLLVVRRDQIATGPGIDPFTFTPGQTVATSSTARSSAITLGGFTGSLTITIPSGVTLFINGVAQTGPTTTVKAGDVLWMEATAPGTSGVPSNYTLTIGSQSATWTFTTGTPAAVPDHPGTDSGYTPVETGVSDSGAAQISIPIVAAPGTGGMQPKLSINYSSQGGNGPLGVGFSLSGLSIISRVGRTVAQDGVKGGVNFDTNDRFALDGQRLIAINGTDGADGTEYRLEFDPTSRIRSYGSGPQRWVVETKAGLIMEYGATANAQISPEGSSTALSWAVSSISDTASNLMTFSYDDTARTRGELLLNYINYGQNIPAGAPVSLDVIFGYSDRPDPTTSYVAGFAVKALKRLLYVESRSRVNGVYTRVRRYEFAYHQAEAANRSQLTSVTETASNGTQLPPTVFEWHKDDPSGFSNGITVRTDPVFLGTSVFGTTYAPFASNPPSRVTTGDFNGDGVMDFVHMNDHPASYLPYSQYVAMGKFGGGFTIGQSIPGLEAKFMTSADYSRLRVGDFNADGKSDLLHVIANGSDNWVALSNGDGSFALRAGGQIGSLATQTMQTGSASELIPMDLNADGRTDVVYLQTGAHKVHLAGADGTFSLVATTGLESYTTNADQGEGWIIPGDFNSDGRADILFVNRVRTTQRQTILALGSGDGTFIVVGQDQIGGAAQMTFESDSQIVSGDFNGDGITDLFCVKRNRSGNVNWTAFGTGSSGFHIVYPNSEMVSPPVSAPDASRIIVADLNGDGFEDIYHADSISTTPIYSWVAFSLGDGTFDYIPYEELGDLRDKRNNRNAESRFMTGDFDGDGTVDVFQLNRDGYHYLVQTDRFEKNRLVKVTNGHGSYTRFDYKPLTDAAVYTKRSGSLYPCYDLQVAMHVVSSVTSRNGIDGDGFNPPPVSPVGENTVHYRYEGAWSCLDGRGFMGFKYVTATDQTSGIITQKQFLNTNPILASQPTSQITYLADGQNISRMDATSAFQQTNYVVGGRTNSTYFVYADDSTTRSFEINQGLGASYFKKTRVYDVAYDSLGNLLQSTTETVPLGAAQTFTETVTNTYNDSVSPTKWHLGRLATSSVTKTGPNPAGAGTVSLTRSSSFTYHPTTGLLTQEVIEPGETTLRQQKDYTHDGFGNILTSTLTVSGEASRTTTTTYTADGRFVATTTNAEGHTESKTYDPLLGNVLTQTGPNGLTTTWDYDAIGRPIREARPDGTVTRSFYRKVTAGTTGAPPRAVHYVRVQSSGGAPKTVWYDLLDREIRTDATAFDGRTVSAHKVFNNRGEVTHASQPYYAGDTPLYSTMLYDAVGREYQQTDPGNRVTKTTYDGLTTTVERNYNPAAPTQFQKAVTVVNAMGWTVQSSQYLGAAAKTVTRSYDPYGNLRFVTDPAGNTTELRYDKRGNKTWMSEPNSGASTFTYNGFGELKTQTNAASQTTTLIYDRLGRVTSRTEPEGVTTFTYDTAAKGIGQLAREAGPGMERRYFYDALARPAATAETHGFHTFSTSRGYDLYSRPESVTYPSGFATRQVYNALGHLSEVQNGANPGIRYWWALQVNARGQVTQEALGNGIVTERAFEAESGIIQGITSTLGSSGDVQSLGFTFDLIGNLTERRDKRFSTHFIETFGYDTLNRLTNLTTTGAAAVTAGYDDLGNLKSRSDVGTFNYAASGPHALSSVTGSSGGTLNKTCAYDAKGNRTSDGGTVLDYSSFNKPTRIRKGGDTLSFDYGPDRALYRQTIFHTDGAGASSQTVREYIGGLYEREITSEGLVRHIHHIAGGNGVVAIHTDERSAASAAQRTRFIHKDHLGSVDAITDSNGVVVERQSYDAWGRRRTVTHNAGTWTVTYPAAPGSAETHRGFTGHEMLDLVGLVHMGGRIYDPITARFLSPDPFVQSPDNLQNLNRYSYVLNNPLSYTDPSGFFFKGIGKFLKNNWKTIVAVGIGVLTGGAFAVAAGFQGSVFGAVSAAFSGSLGISGMSAGLSAAIFGGGMGFGSAFSGTLLAGGSVGDALRAGLIGGVTGAAQGRIAFGIGEKFGHVTGWNNLAEKTIAHGFTSGVLSTATGGNFRHGFLAGAVIPGTSMLAAEMSSSVARFAVATLAGGTASELGGGKFANGAVTGAVIYLFNESCKVTVKTDASDIVGHTQLQGSCGPDSKLPRLNFSFGPDENERLTWLDPTTADSTSSWQHTEYTYKQSFTVSSEDYTAMVNKAESFSGTSYNLYYRNCTTTALDVLRAGGVHTVLPIVNPRGLENNLRMGLYYQR